METNRRGGLFYGWVIVFAGCLIMASVMGIVYNCFSQFIKPVCADLGFTRQAMSFNQTLISLIQVAVGFVWGGILSRVRVKPLMLFWAVVGPAAFFCYSFANNIWLFYVISAVMSLTMSMLTLLPLSYMISNWFVEKKGLATGICFMGSGIGGMVLNPLLQRWLDQFGWRMSFRILAVIMAVCAIPCVLMMVERPEKKGLRALGADKLPQTEGTAAEAEGETMAHARGTVRYWVLATSVLLISAGCSSLVMTLSPHLTDSGYSAAFAAGMVSVSMGAMAVGKMLLGWLYDVLGSKRASLLSVLCGFLGLLGMIFCRVTPALGLIILGVGLGCAFGTVGPPIVVMNVFGKRDYSAIVGVFISFVNIGGAIAPTVNGTVYDLAGSYTPGYAAWAVALGLVLFCFTIFLPSGRKDK